MKIETKWPVLNFQDTVTAHKVLKVLVKTKKCIFSFR